MATTPDDRTPLPAVTTDDRLVCTSGPEVHRIDRWIADWLLEKTNLSNSKETFTTYQAILRDYRRALWSHGLDLDRFDRLPDLQSLAQLCARTAAREKAVKPATIRLRLAAVSSFYEFCVRQGYIPSNPIAIIKRPRQQRKQGARPLNGEVVAARIAAIEERNRGNRHVREDVRGLLTARDEALLLVYLETCRRLSEVASLSWGDIRVSSPDTDGVAATQVTLCYQRLKGGKKAQDTLSPEVSEALLAWLRLFYQEPFAQSTMQPSAPLWVSLSFGGKGLSSYGRKLGEQAIADICKKYLGDSRVHVTRHTGAKLRLDQGADLRHLKKKLSHSSLAVTDLYVEDLTDEEDPHAQTVATALLSRKRKRASREEPLQEGLVDEQM